MLRHEFASKVCPRRLASIFAFLGQWSREARKRFALFAIRLSHARRRTTKYESKREAEQILTPDTRQSPTPTTTPTPTELELAQSVLWTVACAQMRRQRPSHDYETKHSQRHLSHGQTEAELKYGWQRCKRASCQAIQPVCLSARETQIELFSNAVRDFFG